MNNKKSGSKVSKATICVCIVAAIVIAVLVGIIIYLLDRPPEPYGAPPDTARVSGARGTVLTPENREQVMAQLEEVAEQDRSYTVSMSRDWVFETALTPSANARVSNIERNSRTVFFDVLLRDTREVVFTSPYLPLGSTLEGFSLDRDIGAGEHDALVVFYLVDDDYEIITDITATVTLIINS